MKENEVFVAIRASLKIGYRQSYKHKGSDKRNTGTPGSKKEHDNQNMSKYINFPFLFLVS